MVNALNSSTNPIQMLNALNAFKNNENVQQNQGLNEIKDETPDGINLSDNNILKNQNTDDIKKFAKIVGEDNLSNEDIQYGLTYGRSVIADYVI